MLKNKTILITGGAGYIGSHTALLLVNHGYRVIIIDNLSQGQPWHHPWAELIKADFGDKAVLSDIFTNNAVTAVMHFAALAQVGQSVKDPLNYYSNNVSKTITLLDSMHTHGVHRFIFSSSCAIYGNPQYIPIDEHHPKNPISPYGNTKLIIETLLQEMHTAHQLQYIGLRYFNAAGAWPEYGLYEHHEPETHLIPLALKATAPDTFLTVFGNQHKTADGTCVRDYLHVRDIAQAHLQALQYLISTGRSDFFNLGTGKGISVQEIIDAVQRVTQLRCNYTIAQPRPGDPAQLIADATKANTMLKWYPKYSAIDTILFDVCRPVRPDAIGQVLPKSY